jgi:hypothetical protein
MSDIEQRIAALEGRVDVLEDRAASQIDFPDEEETESVVTYSLHEYYVNTWVDRPIPFTGTRVINKTYFSDAAYVTLGQFKITAIDGDLEFETDAFEETGIAAPFVDYHGKFASGVITFETNRRRSDLSALHGYGKRAPGHRFDRSFLISTQTENLNYEQEQYIRK